jgi:Flp pilus assembly pilin Flp
MRQPRRLVFSGDSERRRVVTTFNRAIVRAQSWLVAARGERGQTFAEYAVIIGIIAVAVVAAVGTLRDAVIGALTTASADI